VRAAILGAVLAFVHPRQRSTVVATTAAATAAARVHSVAAVLVLLVRNAWSERHPAILYRSSYKNRQSKHKHNKSTIRMMMMMMMM
jgi:hypothetical protein